MDSQPEQTAIFKLPKEFRVVILNQTSSDEVGHAVPVEQALQPTGNCVFTGPAEKPTDFHVGDLIDW